MTTVIPGYDAIGAAVGLLPPGQHAGYVTGSGAVPWTAAQFNVDPGAIRICQDPGATVATADILDIESGAATPQDAPGWVTRARACYAAGKRPGQRQPMIYCSESMLQPVIDELTAAGINHVPFWMARPGLSLAVAAAEVVNATGNFPCGGVQYAWHQNYDSNVWNAEWLAQQSGLPLVSTVSVGCSGPAVLGLQEMLKLLGVNITVDGLFGLGTLAAVQAFQTAANLVKDGIVGQATWKALLDEQPGPPPPPPPPPPPAPKPSAAPTGLGDRVLSIGSLITFSWHPVPGVSEYHLQVELFKPGFGWILTTDLGGITGTSKAVQVSPRSTYRWRVAADTAAHVWPDWVSFKTT